MLEQKLDRLKKILYDMDSAIIAFSGGVDSTFLLKVAQQVLGEKVIAVTSESMVAYSKEYEDAKIIVQQLGVKQIVIHTNELEIEGFSYNPTDRCYYCKREIFKGIQKIAKENNIKYVVDGTNSDDKNEYRPGLKALVELGVVSPLKEANLSKEEIRILSKQYGLPTWNKPSNTCLFTRFPYNTEITIEKIEMVAKAEKILAELGFIGYRVRHYGDTARIEVDKMDFEKIISVAEEIVKKLKEVGYTYITLDLEGFRSGSMDLKLKNKGIEL